MADDFRNSYNDASAPLGSVTSGSSSSGSIEVTNDIDVFAITLVQGVTYSFDMDFVAGGTTSLTLHNSTGGYITGTFGFNGDPAHIQFTATISGTFYLSAAGSTTTGAYTLSSSAGFIDDFRDTYNDTLETLGALAPGGSKSGVIETPGDADVFAITLTKGTTYAFELDPADAGALKTSQLTILNATGGYINGTFGFNGDKAQLLFTATVSGQYYLSGSANGTNLGAYTIKSSAGFIDDYRDTFNDELETLGTISLGVTKNGVLETPDDTDVFQVSLVKGQTYTFELKETAAGTLVSTNVTLLNASGGYIDNEFGFNSDPAKLVFTAAETGTYYLTAEASTSTATGSYALSVLGSFVDDYRDVFNDMSETLGVVTAGGSNSGVVEIGGDKDIFAITLTAGRTYELMLDGAAGSTLTDTSLTVQNGAGGFLDSALGFAGDPAHLYFTAKTSGTHYLSVGGSSSTATGEYSISASAGFVDDYRDHFNATHEALGAIAPGGTKTGVIEIGGDTDIFKVTLTAGQTYTFNMDGTAGSTLSNSSLVLQNKTGGFLNGDASISGEPASFKYTATSTDTYYLAASGSPSTTVGSYAVSVSNGTVTDDYRNTYDDSSLPLGALAVNGSKTGIIGVAGDDDIFAVTLQAGMVYGFDLIGTGSPALANPELSLLNGSGAVLLTNGNFNGFNSHIVFRAAASGTYYLNAQGATTSTGSYRISATLNYDDYRDSIADATRPFGTLAVNGSSQGVIELVGDRDFFAITLAAGQTYAFDLKSSAVAAAALADAQLTLLDSAGTVLVTNNDFNSLNSHIVYTASASGTYYLSAHSAVAAGTGGYAVSSKLGFDDVGDSYNGSAGVIGKLAVNSSQIGVIETAGDKDVFSVSLTAGQSYTIDLSGTATGALALADAELTLLSNAGAVIRINDDFNSLHSRIVFTATVTATYYLDVHSSIASGTGGYTISVNLNADDFRDSRTDTSDPFGLLAVNSSLLGVIETAGDQDFFAVSLVKGQSYSFDLAGSAAASVALANPELRLLNGAGTVLITNNDFNSVSSRIVYMAAATGTYYLDAHSFIAAGTGGYIISAKQNFDDYRDTTIDTTAPFGSVAVGGSKMGAIETIGDSDYFVFNLQAGKTYDIDLLEGPGAGFIGDGDMQLLSAGGVHLAYSDDANGTQNAEITYTADRTGVYYLNVGGVGIRTGVYEVELGLV